MYRINTWFQINLPAKLWRTFGFAQKLCWKIGLALNFGCQFREALLQVILAPVIDSTLGRIHFLKNWNMVKKMTWWNEFRLFDLLSSNSVLGYAYWGGQFCWNGERGNLFLILLQCHFFILDFWPFILTIYTDPLYLSSKPPTPISAWK